MAGLWPNLFPLCLLLAALTSEPGPRRAPWDHKNLLILGSYALRISLSLYLVPANSLLKPLSQT